MSEENEEEEQDQDSIKEAFLETNIYLLVLTFVVSIVHSVFEFLAFKNDIQFWNNRKSLEGLSVRSVFFNVFQSLIVLLYVLDNDTNTVVRISCFIGLCIEIWKINKVTNINFDTENRILGIIPRISFQDKGDYDTSGTKEFDRMAFRYLGVALFPLAFCYCIYSVLYNEHKGWYSFILGSCYGFLLTFGFIKMTTMYRIGCFRDDIVFFIMLYQRYIYREDPSRLNEFGFSAEMLAQKELEKQNNGAPAAIEGGEPVDDENAEK